MNCNWLSIDLFQFQHNFQIFSQIHNFNPHESSPHYPLSHYPFSPLSPLPIIPSPHYPLSHRVPSPHYPLSYRVQWVKVQDVECGPQAGGSGCSS